MVKLWFLLIFTTYLYAQSESTEILIEDYRDNFNGSRTVIGNSENGAVPSSTLKATFNRLPGFDFVNNSLFFRGSESHQILVVIDNILVSDPTAPSNGFDFSKINFFEVETMELLTGAQTLKYGDKAFAGVLVITTKQRTKLGQSLRVRETLGSYQTFNSNIAYENRVSSKWNHALTFNREDRTVDSAAKPKVGQLFEKDRTLKNSLSLKSIFNQGDNLYQFNLKGVMVKDESDAGAFADDPNFMIYEKSLFSGLTYLRVWSETFSQELNLNTNLTKKKFDNPDSVAAYAYTDYYTGKRHEVKLENSYEVASYRLSGGLTFSSEELKIDSNQTYNRLPQKSVTSSGLNLLWNNHFSEKLNLAVASSLEQVNLQGGRTQTLKNGSLSPMVKVAKAQVRLFADLAFNEKPATLYQLFAPGYGNLNLEHEELVKYSVGTDLLMLANDKITVSYFKSRYTNLIDYDFTTNKYMNISGATIDGLELYNNFSTKNVALNSNATFMKAVNSRGERLLRRPYFKSNHELTLPFSEQVSGEISYQYIGKRKDRVELPAYYLVGSELKVTLKKDMVTTLKVNNLFNREYEEVAGFFSPKRSLFLDFACAF